MDFTWSSSIACGNLESIVLTKILISVNKSTELPHRTKMDVTHSNNHSFKCLVDTKQKIYNKTKDTKDFNCTNKHIRKTIKTITVLCG